MPNPQGVPLANQPFVDPTFRITQSWRQFLVSLWDRSGGSSGGNVFSSGDVKVWPGDTVQSGWVECNGQAISRTLYAGLFAVLGTTWGAGDGTTTFNVPDFRERSLVGANGTTINVGDTGGAASITLTTGQLPAHDHAVTDPGHTHAFTGAPHTHSINDPGHNHEAAFGASNVTAGAAAGGVVPGFTLDNVTGITINNATAGGTNAGATTGVTTQNTGAGDAVPTQSPYAGVLYVIKA